MVKLSKEELNKLSSLHGLSSRRLSNASLNNTALRDGITNSISQFLIAFACGIDKQADNFDEQLSNALKESSAENAFSKSMAVAIVMGYFQSLNNDIATIEEKEFGFKGLDEALKSALAMYCAELVSDEKSAKTLESGLNVKIRDCSGEEYFKSECYHEDIETLSDLLTAGTDDGYNTRVIEALKRNSDVSGSVTRYLADIRAVYDLLFEDSFGIEQYKGVLQSDKSFLTIEEGSLEATQVKEGPRTLAKFAKRVYQKIDERIQISDKRQFDYDEIFESQQIVYFPRKILEYALGRESTLNVQANKYRPSAYSISWAKYSTEYVYVNIEAVLYRGEYKALERLLGKDFTDPTFTAKVDDYDDFVAKSLTKAGVDDKLRKMMGKLVRSIKSAYILTKYPYLANNIAAINFRICAEPTLGGLTPDLASSTYLFKNLVAENESETFLAPINISEGRTSSIGVAVSSRIYEYQYDINPLLTKAEPLFGYTIQQLNKRKGRAAGWDNILIGQSLSGKELYASAKSDIKMQLNFTHNIIAGSRSGKGVMTMNILANALAAGKPIFYLDRKPDMASMLYNISSGQQFIVNGGLYQAEFDNCDCFSEGGGDALKMWREVGKPYLDANPQIAELFGSLGQGYYSVIGDYIYFRAFMFCLGICVLRTKLKGDHDDIRNSVFGGDNGVVIVVDELTGFQASISRLFSTITSKFVQATLKLGDIDKVIETRDRLEREIAVYEQKGAEASKESARMQAESKIADIKAQLNSIVDEQGVYAATLFQKICDSYLTLIDNKIAGFQGKEFKYSDVFVLGQILDAGYFASSLTSINAGSLSSVFFPLTANKSDYYSAYKGADIIRSFLEELGQGDWFLGRNPGYPYAKKPENPAAIQCLDKDGNWEYVGTHSCNEVKGVDDASFDNPVFFKPYLVLNTSNEANPPLDGTGDFQYVAQCADRVNRSAGGVDLWETVRLKHLQPGVRDKVTSADKQYGCLNEGIGFKGLIRDTLETTEKGRKAMQEQGIDSYIIETLKKSGDIANYVAEAMGYSCWQALIYDLSPNGLFSFNDMVNAVINKDAYSLESRLPIYSKLGLIGNDKESSTGEQSGSQSFADMFGDLEPTSDFDSPTQHTPSQPVDSSTQSSSSASESTGNAASDWEKFNQSAWGSDGDDMSDYEDDSDTGRTEPVHQSQPQPSVDISRALLAMAKTIVSMEVANDQSGYQYSSEDIEDFELYVVAMLKNYMGVD